MYNKNAKRVRGFFHGDLKVDSANYPIVQGEMVKWDASSHIAVPVSAADVATNLLGVSSDCVPARGNVKNDTTSLPEQINAEFNDIFEMDGTVNDVLYDFDEVYVGANSTTVKKTQGGTGQGETPQKAVGYVRLPSGTASLTVAASTKVPVFMYSRMNNLVG
jgi:hypothetical protein